MAIAAAIGCAAHGLASGLLAAAVAFSPSFSFHPGSAKRFERLRHGTSAQGFLDGARPGAIGAILGAAITLATALAESWQSALLAAAAIALLALGRGVAQNLLSAAIPGTIAALAGAPLL